MPKRKNQPLSLTSSDDNIEISATANLVIPSSSNLSVLKPYWEGLKFIFVIVFVGVIVGFIAFLFLPAVGIARAESTRRSSDNTFPLLPTELSSLTFNEPSATDFVAATMSQERFARSLSTPEGTALPNLHHQITSYQENYLPSLPQDPYSQEIKEMLHPVLNHMKQSRDSNKITKQFDMLKKFTEASRLIPIMGAISNLSGEHSMLEQYSQLFEIFIINYRSYHLSISDDFCDIEITKNHIKTIINLFKAGIDLMRKNKNNIKYLLDNLKQSDAFDLLINNNEHVTKFFIEHFSYDEILQWFTKDNFFRKISFHTFLQNFMTQVNKSVDVAPVAAMFDFFEFYEKEVIFSSAALQFIKLSLKSELESRRQKQTFEQTFRDLGPRSGNDRAEALENIVERAEELHQRCKTNMYYRGIMYAPYLWDKLFSPFDGVRLTPELALALTMHIEEAWAPEPRLKVHQSRLFRLLNKLALTENTTFHMSEYSCTLRELLEVAAHKQGLDYYQLTTASLLHYRDFYDGVTNVTNYHALVTDALLEKASDPHVDVDEFIGQRLHRQVWQRLLLMVSAVIGAGAGIIAACRVLFNKPSIRPRVNQLTRTAPDSKVIRTKPLKQKKSGTPNVTASSSDATTPSGRTVVAVTTATEFVLPSSSHTSTTAIEQRPQELNSDRFMHLSGWCQRQQSHAQRLLTRVSQGIRDFGELEFAVQSSMSWMKSRLDTLHSELTSIFTLSMPETDKQLDTLYLDAFENTLKANRKFIKAVPEELQGYEATLTACRIPYEAEPLALSPLSPEENSAANISRLATNDGASSSSTAHHGEETPPDDSTKWVVLHKSREPSGIRHAGKIKSKRSKGSSLHGQTTTYQLQLQMAQECWTALINAYPVSLIDSSVSIHAQMETRMILWGWILEKTLALLDEHSIISGKVSLALRKTAETLRNVLVHPFSNISNEQFNALAKTLKKETNLSELSTKLEALKLATLLPKMSDTSSSTQVIATQAMGPIFALNTLIYYLRLLEQRAKAGVDSMLASTTFPYVFRSQLVAIRECWHCANTLIRNNNKEDKFLYRYFGAFIQRANLEAHQFITSQQVQKFLDFSSELSKVIERLEAHLPRPTTRPSQEPELSLPSSSVALPILSMRADVDDFNPYSVPGPQLFGTGTTGTTERTGYSEKPFSDEGYRFN